MYIETKRLVLRDLIEQDAEALFEIKNDEQVKKHPFAQGDETIDFIRMMISFFLSVQGKGLIIDDQHPERGYIFAIGLKGAGDVIGVITVHPLNCSNNELHMGWYMKHEYTGKGYASEAGSAASDYLLEALSLDYITADVAKDNPASFRTALKSGFSLFEQRIGYNYQDNECNVEDCNAAGEYFSIEQIEIGPCNYHFRKFNQKFNKNSGSKNQFYGETYVE